MNPVSNERYPSLYATPELVGRDEILEPCKRILSSTSRDPKVIFLYGIGGIGKTRLLQRVLEIARQLPNVRAAEDVLDFYDILLHTPIELTNAIFEALTPPFDCFQIYQSTAQVLNRARLSGNAVELEKLRHDTLNKFEQDLRQLAKTNRVVLSLDTLERVVYGLFGLTHEIPLADAWIWLIERLPTWENVLIFTAGRERAFPAVERLKSTHPEMVEEIKVDKFTLDESLKYFENVARLVRDKGDYHLAERLENMPQDFKRGAHVYSQGRPIMLSLLVDYLGFPNANNLPDMLRYAPAENPSEEEVRLYEQELFNRLREGDLGETLIALGRVPKGCDEELLSKLITKKNNKGEYQPLSEDETLQRLRDVQRLSVIKIRRLDDEQRFFLHDEMYDLLQRHVYSSYIDATNQKQAFEAIKNFYQERREKSIERLNRLYAPVEEHGRIDLDLQELNKAHAYHQSILAEIMYYHLREDLGRGFRTYSRYAQDAILSRDVLMDLQLQAELLSFLGSPPAPILENDISIEMILASLNIRPFARAWAQNKFEEGIQDSKNFLENVGGAWHSRFPGLLAALHAWIASLHVLRGQKENLTAAEYHLGQVYSLLPSESVDRPFADQSHVDTILWYEKSIAAFTHRAHGYLKRIQGFMKEAEAEYQKAGVLLREIDLRCEMAAIKNDMGFVQAELGKYHDGRANVLNALELRKELGRRVPVALSLNTIARVDVHEGRYREAQRNSERSLAIFRAFTQHVVMGMALTALAEATRRVAGTDPVLAVDARIELLRKARDHAREAQSLFTTYGGEPSRLAEAMIEIGCACRDWVWWLKNYPRPGDDDERIFQESWDAFTRAAELAQANNLTFRYLDALVNRAWLEFYRFDAGNQSIGEPTIYDLIDETEKAFPPDNEIDKQPQIWAQKGKLYVLKGRLARRQLIECRKSEPKGISPTIVSLLESTAENYALGLEYSNRFAHDYRGIRQAKDSVSDKLKDLNSAEMRILCNRIRALYPDGSTIQTLLMNRALWQTD